MIHSVQQQISRDGSCFPATVSSNDSWVVSNTIILTHNRLDVKPHQNTHLKPPNAFSDAGRHSESHLDGWVVLSLVTACREKKKKRKDNVPVQISVDLTWFLNPTVFKNFLCWSSLPWKLESTLKRTHQWFPFQETVVTDRAEKGGRGGDIKRQIHGCFFFWLFHSSRAESRQKRECKVQGMCVSVSRCKMGERID